MPEPELHRHALDPSAPRVESTGEVAPAGGQERAAPSPRAPREQEPSPTPEDAAPPMSQIGPDHLAELWSQLRGAIRKSIAPEQYETWFRRADLVAVSGESLCLAVQNAFSRDWLQKHYLAVIEEAIQKVFSRRLRVDFRVDPELVAARAPAPAPKVEEPEPAAEGRPSGLSERLPADSAVNYKARGSDIGLNPRYTFDNFVVGPCNRFCHAVSLGTAEAPGKAYNPLFLHGNVGLGKTHLLQAICFTLIQNWKDVRILYLSCETFVNHFIGALEHGDLEKFRNKYRNVDVLVVDDIHLLANKERTQEEFFHTFNTLYNAGKQIILSSDSPPKDIPTLQERLVSRFKWGLVTEIEPPCYETRMAILKRKGRERGNELPEEVAQLLAERVDTNIRELEGSVNKLYSFANVTGQPITVAFARELLPDLFQKRRGAPSMEDIIEVVTGHFGVRLSDLQSKKRTNQIAYPRQVAMYLARRITRHSLEEIGGFFGGRDHSTVLHAVRKIEAQIEADEGARALIADLLERLQGPAL
jgi:chromosomal replication initiator protein